MGKNMDPGNLYGVMTIIAALLSFPLALIVEGPRFSATYKAALLAGNTAASIWRGTIMSGVYFYL
jgi:NhaP-type Na+/H+ and K+/H+ antiporter